MKIIEGLTDQPKQQTTLTLDDGSKVVWSLQFKPQQRGWFYDVTWNGVDVVLGQRLVAAPNILRQQVNVIPFGIAILTAGNLDPTSVEDFSEGIIVAYLLNRDDLSEVETVAFNAPPLPQQPVAVGPSGNPVVIPPRSWGPAGGDLSQSYPDPWVAAVHEATGQQLTMGAIADGKFLKRVGSSIVGEDASGAGGVTVYATMGALRAAAVPAANTVALLGGFSSNGDGGGGLFQFITPDASTLDDGGTLIVPGGSPPVVDSGGNITVDGTQATVGCWRRVAAMNAFKGGEGFKDVRWFGAIANNSTDNVPAFRLALASIRFSSGCLYIPAGQWAMAQKFVVDLNIHAGTVTIKGDGPGATILEYGMTGADTCLIEVFGGFGFGSLQDFQIHWPGYAGVYSNPSVIWVHDTTSFNLVNVMCSGLINRDLTGGIFKFGETGSGENTNLTMIGCSAVGVQGCAIFWGRGSGLVSTNNFTTGNRGPGAAWVTGTNYGPGMYATNAGVVYMCRNVLTPSTVAPGSAPADWEVVPLINCPCSMITGTNTLKLSNNFYSGGGPTFSMRGSSLTRTGTTFTITTATAHNRIIGDYILVADASQAAFNNWWKVASVTSNTITVNYVNALSADTVTVSSLWSCFYATGITESEMSFCFFNTGGGPGLGSVGVYLDGYHNPTSGVGEFSISDCICDYGACAFFLHGLTNADPASTMHQITLTNCRPNGGPRDEFGCYRVEGATTVSIDGCRAFPGDNNPPGTGKTFRTFVISDGGQAHNTQDITITGGIATNKNSSALYPAATIVAFTFDGPRVHNVSVQNCGVDAAQTVVSLLNSAVASNGLTVMYGDNAGRVQLFDSTGTHAL